MADAANPNECTTDGLRAPNTLARKAIIDSRYKTTRDHIHKIVGLLSLANAVIPYERQYPKLPYKSDTIADALQEKGRNALLALDDLKRAIKRQFGVDCVTNYYDFRADLSAFRAGPNNFNLEDLLKSTVATMMSTWRSEINGAALLLGYATARELPACPIAHSDPGNWWLWCKCATVAEMDVNVDTVLANAEYAYSKVTTLINGNAALPTHRKKETEAILLNSYNTLLHRARALVYCYDNDRVERNLRSFQHLLNIRRDEHKDDVLDLLDEYVLDLKIVSFFLFFF